MKAKKLLAVSALMLSTSSCATTVVNTYSSIGEFVQSISNSSGESEATGDLNNDGRPDWVGSIQRKYVVPRYIDGIEYNNTSQIYVLAQLPSRRYTVIGKSLEMGAEHGTTNTDPVDIKIKEQSFYIKQAGIWKNCWRRTTYRFTFRDDEWRLIEIDYNSAINAAGEDASLYKELEIRKNLLNGTKIVTLITGSSKPKIAELAGNPGIFNLASFPSANFGLDESDYEGDPCR